MKILVYGCGVIGSYLVHELYKAGNDVTVVSKGKWGDVLKTDSKYSFDFMVRTITCDPYSCLSANVLSIDHYM